MGESILTAKNLSKFYADHSAVNDFSLEIQAASVYGLLGSNGAGKSSIIRMLAGIFLPDKGQIVLKPNLKLGYLPEERGLYPNMRVLEHLEFLGQLKGLSSRTASERALKALDEIGLGEWKQRQVKQLSKGMQQKVQILSTILHEPDLLILDEPFSGLDPLSLLQICELLKNLKARGTAIVISTHQLKVAEEICNHFSLLSKGQVKWQGTTADLKNIFGKKLFQFQLKLYPGQKELEWPHNLSKAIDSEKEISRLNLEDHSYVTYELSLKEPADFREFLQFLSEEYYLEKFSTYSPTLDDVFKRLLG